MLAESGSYPVVLGGHDHDVYDESRGFSRVLKAGQDAQNVFVVDLVWPKGTARRCWPTVTAELVPLCGKKAKKGQPAPAFEPRFPADTLLVEQVKHWKAPVAELINTTLAHYEPMTPPLSSIGTRFHCASMATLIATALRDASCSEGCLINGGALRGEREYLEGVITFADLCKECPYPSSQIVISVDGQTLSNAVRASRKLWTDKPGEENNQGLHVDEDMLVDPKTHMVTEVAGEKMQADRLYSIVCDAHAVRRNPVLKQYAERNPDRIPPDDAGLPALPTLVGYFCKVAWKKLAGADGLGNISQADVDSFFDRADLNGDGLISEEEMIRAIKAMLGNDMGTGVMAKRMLSLADTDQDGKVSREELQKIFIAQAKQQTADVLQSDDFGSMKSCNRGKSLFNVRSEATSPSPAKKRPEAIPE